VLIKQHDHVIECEQKIPFLFGTCYSTNVYHYDTATSACHSQFMDKVVSEVLANGLMPVFGWFTHGISGRRRERAGVGGCWQTVTSRDDGGRDSRADGRYSGRRRRINAQRLVHLQQ